ncbi:uncharacterized protein SPSK_10947 [Sporothrix schenckii 1099-18]|uniref:Uncharacterized protein n=1 Tax=Sporothrix schenckii 1099-18 TaxID=1397361 RepID=A0A0F2M9R5_SPOSC|nr:uncharacterized protein SPSK_10947 [Sporothrix schenckii 1099-18]KJR84906.1 hypothetical protein SPSK_10947 [Sporothrix schenckii 1099-18]
MTWAQRSEEWMSERWAIVSNRYRATEREEKGKATSTRQNNQGEEKDRKGLRLVRCEAADEQKRVRRMGAKLKD